MKKLSLAIVISLFAASGLFAQDWTEMMKTSHANFKDVQNSFYTWYAQHKSDKATSEEENKTISSSNEEEGDGNYELFKRWEWYMKLRTGPTGNLPDRIAITRNYQNFLANHAPNSNARLLSAQQWSYIGPTSPPPGGGGAGRVNHIRINPSNSNILFACCY
jgi:hypothetical protein